ncbi:FtsK/SpoIIIE domain-containing protein [Streptomyces sp. NPDC001380]|uniref:FtsK/SpoIIIE domain-containing protein n=1 Tax=Streptomyces sp. NPDC001380 TaxID=3364566 RepID=UPI00369B1A80
MSDTLRRPGTDTPEERPVGDLVDLDKHRRGPAAPVSDSVYATVPAPAADPSPADVLPAELPEDPDGDRPFVPAWARHPEGRRAARVRAQRRTRRAVRRWASRQRTERGHLAQVARGVRRSAEWVGGIEGAHLAAARHQAHTATREARQAARRARYTLVPAQRRAAQQHADRAQTVAVAAVAAHAKAKAEVRRGRLLRGSLVWGLPGLADGVALLEGGWPGLAAGTAAVLGGFALAGRRPLAEETWSDEEQRVLGDGDPLTDRMLDAAFRAAKVIGDGESLRLVTPCMRDVAAWTVTVDLPAGRTAAKAAAAADALAAALGVEAAQVHLSRAGRAGRLHLWVSDDLPFTGKVAPGPLLSRDRPTSLWEQVAIGVTVRGDRYSMSLVERSLLVGGEPGAGKSASANAVLLGAALDPTVILSLADGKGGGDLEDYAPLATRYEGAADPEALYALLQDVLADMGSRYALLKSLGARKVTAALAAEHPELRLHLLWIDELMYYTTDEEWGRKIVAALRNIVSRGRAAGIITGAATQKPGADVVPSSLRDLLSIRWALRCTTPQASDTILGQGRAAAGYTATLIEPQMRGAGWLLSEGAEPVMVRSDYYDDGQVRALLQRARIWREAAGTLPGQGPTLAERLCKRGGDGELLAVLVEEFDRRDDAEWLPGSVLVDALRAAGHDVTPERLAALVVRSDADKAKRAWEGSRVSGYPRLLVAATAQQLLTEG